MINKLQKRLKLTNEQQQYSEKLQKLLYLDKEGVEYEPLTTEQMLEMDELTVFQKIELKHPGFKIVNKILPGEGFGEIALRQKSQVNLRTATIVCSKDTYFLQLDKQSYNQILRFFT